MSVDRFPPVSYNFLLASNSRVPKQIIERMIFFRFFLWKLEAVWWNLDTGNQAGAFTEASVWVSREANTIGFFSFQGSITSNAEKGFLKMH